MEYIPPRNGNVEDPNRPYINANPLMSVEGSIPVAEAFEHHQRELVHLITEAGLQPSSSDLTQVLQAVKHFAEAWFPKPKQIGEVLTNTEDGIAWVLPTLEYLERYRVSRIGHIQSGDIQGLSGEFCIADGRQVLFENYPELKASANMELLQRSLNEVEDQIAASRRAYNIAVRELNNAVDMIPTNIFASMLNIKRGEFIEIKEQERENVNVSQLFKK